MVIKPKPWDEIETTEEFLERAHQAYIMGEDIPENQKTVERFRASLNRSLQKDRELTALEEMSKVIFWGAIAIAAMVVLAFSSIT